MKLLYLFIFFPMFIEPYTEADPFMMEKQVMYSSQQRPTKGLIAFPGAEGFGRYTTGGRGGKVYHVTTLEDGMEEGTLCHALTQNKPRTIVFDVAGTIFLTKNLPIINGDLTIAGQTAPGQGVCIAGHPVTLNADNIIIRYVRFRVGNEGQGEPDGLVTTHPAEQAYKLILAYAGCSKERDIIDTRIIEETREGTATYTGSVSKDAKRLPGLIDLPNDVKPEDAVSAWPELNNGGICADDLKDSDNDGIPDAWEIKHNLNPQDTLDGSATTLSKEGHTNLEVYINSLIEEITQKQVLPPQSPVPRTTLGQTYV